MASRGRGHKGGGWGNNQPPPAFDHQAFIEAISVATATLMQTGVIVVTIAQTCPIGNQGGGGGGVC